MEILPNIWFFKCSTVEKKKFVYLNREFLWEILSGVA